MTVNEQVLSSRLVTLLHMKEITKGKGRQVVNEEIYRVKSKLKMMRKNTQYVDRWGD